MAGMLRREQMNLSPCREHLFLARQGVRRRRLLQLLRCQPANRHPNSENGYCDNGQSRQGNSRSLQRSVTGRNCVIARAAMEAFAGAPQNQREYEPLVESSAVVSASLGGIAERAAARRGRMAMMATTAGMLGSFGGHFGRNLSYLAAPGQDRLAECMCRALGCEPRNQASPFQKSSVISNPTMLSISRISIRSCGTEYSAFDGIARRC